MALEEGTFRVGGVTYPLVAATTNSLLKDADPALYYAIEFGKSVLNTYLSARIVAQAALCEAPIQAAVMSTANYDAGPFILEHSQLTLPVFAVWRASEKYEERTQTWDHVESTWKMGYILPAFQHYGGFDKIKPIQKSVGDVLRNRFGMGWDPGFLSGAKIFASSYANVETIDVMDGEYGRYEDGQGIYYESVVFTCRVRERTMPVTGAFDAMAGIDTNLDVAQTGATTLADVVVLDTDTSP